MSEAVLKEHLRLASQSAKAYTNEKAVEFNSAVVSALEEMAELKADQQATTTALSGKVDKVSGATAGNFAVFASNGALVDDDVRTITPNETAALIAEIFS